MMQPTQSAPLALPRNSMPDNGHWATLSPVSHNNPGSSATNVQHMFGPVNPAEVAQARLFEKALQAEYVELNRIAGTMVARPTASEAHRSRINARIGEVHGLLEALRDRFPHVRLASELSS